MSISHSALEAKPAFNSNEISGYLYHGDLGAVKRIPRVIMDSYGFQILYMAVGFGQYAIAKYLIKDCKVDVREPAKELFDRQTTLLDQALFNYNSDDNLENIFDLLVNAGIDIYNKAGDHLTPLCAISSRLAYITSPANVQQYINIIKKLIDKKIDVNAQMKPNGYTALILASESAKSEVCRLLLDAGADLCVKMNKSNLFHTAISKAIEYKNFVLAEELIQYAIDESKQGKYALKEALGPSVLFAVEKHNLPLLKQLIELRVDINVEDQWGRNAMDFLVEFAHKFSEEELRNFTLTLLQAGININARINSRMEQKPGALKLAEDYKNSGKVVHIIECLKTWPYNLEKRKILSESLVTIFRNPLVHIVDEYAVPDVDGVGKLSQVSGSITSKP